MEIAAGARPLEKIITEKDFLEVFRRIISPLFSLGLIPKDGSQRTSKSYLYRLTQETNELESMLDDHGARNNKVYSLFTELIASLRGFAHASYSIVHLRKRLRLYVLDDGTDGLLARFEGDLDEVASFLIECIERLQLALAKEGLAIGVPACSWERSASPDSSESTVRRMLPRNIDEEDIDEEEGKTAEVITSFIKAVTVIGKLDSSASLGEEGVRRFREQHCTEDLCRLYEASVHNIQSKYDTYIQTTFIEKQNPRLRVLRGHASVVLHLLECATFLIHFYERHENDIRYEASKALIAKLIDKTSVTKVVVRFCLSYAAQFMKAGRACAETLLAEFTDIGSVQLSLPEDFLLHARPCSMIVKIVNHYGTPVEMEIEGERCDASSIMQVMILVGSHSKCRDVIFYGDKLALKDLRSLFACGFGEVGGSPLAPQLQYLTN